MNHPLVDFVHTSEGLLNLALQSDTGRLAWLPFDPRTARQPIKRHIPGRKTVRLLPHFELYAVFHLAEEFVSGNQGGVISVANPALVIKLA